MELTVDWFVVQFLLWLVSLKMFYFTLFILLIVNVFLGLAVALKLMKFDWRKLVNFFQSDVLPKIIGWTVISFLSWFIAPELLGDPLGPQIANGLTAVLWAGIMLSFGGDILSKLAALGWKLVERIPGVINDKAVLKLPTA